MATTWQAFVGPTEVQPFSYNQAEMDAWDQAHAGQETKWNPRDAKLMTGYLSSVSAAMGKPDFDWLPYLKASQDAHEQAYGIKFASDRSNPYAAINDVLSRAGLSQYAVSQDNVAQMTDAIQKVQGSMSTNWLKSGGPLMLASVLTAGLASAALGAGDNDSGDTRGNHKGLGEAIPKPGSTQWVF